MPINHRSSLESIRDKYLETVQWYKLSAVDDCVVDRYHTSYCSDWTLNFELSGTVFQSRSTMDHP